MGARCAVAGDCTVAGGCAVARGCVVVESGGMMEEEARALRLDGADDKADGPEWG